MKELTGRVAVVTGASRGIGAAIARRLAREGCHVVLAARSQDRIEQLAAALHNDYGVRALAIPTDMSDTAQVESMIQQAEMEFGGIDILVNNAGVGIYGEIAEVQEQDLRYVFDVNFFGVVKAIQTVVPGMRRRGEGVIVNVSSVVGKFALPMGGGYSATKFALQAISSAARAELAADNIHVIVVCPGLTDTEFAVHSRISTAQGDRKTGERPNPMRGVAPERVAERVVQAIYRQEAEVYVTWFDQLMVRIATRYPGLLNLIAPQVARIRRKRFADMIRQSGEKQPSGASMDIRMDLRKMIVPVAAVAVFLALLVGRGPKNKTRSS
jgi:short-subunit dehydrogenase